jgi:hypothetical protein
VRVGNNEDFECFPLQQGGLSEIETVLWINRRFYRLPGGRRKQVATRRVAEQPKTQTQIKSSIVSTYLH